MSNSSACRTVAVNRRTGTRWRYGHSIPSVGGGLLHYPPVIMDRGRTEKWLLVLCGVQAQGEQGDVVVPAAAGHGGEQPVADLFGWGLRVQCG